MKTTRRNLDSFGKLIWQLNGVEHGPTLSLSASDRQLTQCTRRASAMPQNATTPGQSGISQGGLRLRGLATMARPSLVGRNTTDS